MRHFDLSCPLALADNKEAGAWSGKGREEPAARFRHLVPLRRLANEATFVIDANHARYESFAERRELGLGRPLLRNHTGRRIADQGLQRRQAGRSVTEAFVFEQLEPAVLAELVVEPAEC